MFARPDAVIRRYRSIVPGINTAQTIEKYYDTAGAPFVVNENGSFGKPVSRFRRITTPDGELAIRIFQMACRAGLFQREGPPTTGQKREGSQDGDLLRRDIRWPDEAGQRLLT